MFKSFTCVLLLIPFRAVSILFYVSNVGRAGLAKADRISEALRFYHEAPVWVSRDECIPMDSVPLR